MKEKDILYENGLYWVMETPSGYYEIYKNGLTYSTRCAIIGYRDKEGLDKAIRECDKRANGDKCEADSY